MIAYWSDHDLFGEGHEDLLKKIVNENCSVSKNVRPQ